MNFSKGECTHNLSGLFSEHELVGILEASDYEELDQSSPFLVATADLFCGNKATVSITTVDKLFANILFLLHRKDVLPCWTDENLEKFIRKIESFKMTATKLLPRFSSIRYGNEKRHMIGHIISALKVTRDVDHLQGSFFESAHRSSKHCY